MVTEGLLISLICYSNLHEHQFCSCRNKMSTHTMYRCCSWISVTDNAQCSTLLTLKHSSIISFHMIYIMTTFNSSPNSCYKQKTSFILQQHICLFTNGCRECTPINNSLVSLDQSEKNTQHATGNVLAE